MYYSTFRLVLNFRTERMYNLQINNTGTFNIVSLELKKDTKAIKNYNFFRASCCDVIVPFTGS